MAMEGKETWKKRKFYWKRNRNCPLSGKALRPAPAPKAKQKLLVTGGKIRHIMGNGVSLERRRSIADFTSPCHEHIDGVPRKWSGILAGIVGGCIGWYGKWRGFRAWSGAFGGNTHSFDIGTLCHSGRNLEKSPVGCFCHGLGRMFLRRGARRTDILFCGGRGRKRYGAWHFPVGAEGAGVLFVPRERQCGAERKLYRCF